MKKVVCILALTCVVMGGAFAQAKKPAQINNWISGEIGLFAAGIRYERMLNSSFSVGVEAYWNDIFFIWNDIGAIVAGRFYPGKNVFFLELGLGYNYHTGIGTLKYNVDGEIYKYHDWISTSGFCISPGLGWRIDPGARGGFFVSPGIKLPITLGIKEPVLHYYWWGRVNKKSEFGVAVGVMPYCALGYAW